MYICYYYSYVYVSHVFKCYIRTYVLSTKINCYLLYKAEKSSVSLSVPLHYLIEWISAWVHRSVSILLEIKATSCGFNKFASKFLTTLVCHLQHFECQSVEDFVENFTYIPIKPQPKHD